MAVAALGAGMTLPCAKACADIAGEDTAAPAFSLEPIVVTAYWLANLRAGIRQQRSAWDFTEALRLDNLTNRSYVGSVIVN
jgi:hypothetical protein